MADKNHDLPCDRCGAGCCRYVAVEIDEPTSKRDYDHIRWYLLHNNVHVFADHEGYWYVEFETDCGSLDAEARCGSYERRPRICRHHGEKDATCEFMDDPHMVRFSNAEEFENYLDEQGIQWRFKKDRSGKKK